MHKHLIRSECIISIIYAYCITLGLIPAAFGMLMMGMEGLFVGVAYIFFSLLAGGGAVFLFSVLIGFPLANSVFKLLKFNYFVNFMLSCIFTLVVTVCFILLSFYLLFGYGFNELLVESALLYVPTIIISLVSGVVYYYRTKKI